MVAGKFPLRPACIEQPDKKLVCFLSSMIEFLPST
jgi:hypothetical protein